MKTIPDEIKISELIALRLQQMLVVNSEYQRGAVWNLTQQKKLVDSVFRGYPIPLIYFHHIVQTAGGLTSQRYEIIDGQQRINALSDFREGAFKLLDPEKDEAEARFPAFVKKQPCPWAGKTFDELDPSLKERFDGTALQIVKIETHDANEARDLFVRLQAGMPLNSQEKRDAWPGQFTEFILKLGGKAGLAKYPGHEFFNDLMKARQTKDRGKFRQLAAQISMLFFTRRREGGFSDINSRAIDDFYYENLDFDSASTDARRLLEILDKITYLLRDKKRSKIIGHEALHLVLLVDSLWDDYTRSWEANFAEAFDKFRHAMNSAKQTRFEASPNEYWLSYGIGTRVNSDQNEVIQRRHEFFAEKMRSALKLQPKDPQRTYGSLEREIVYYRDRKRCAVCESEVLWDEAEIHHVDPHAIGGQTVIKNGALVHKHCHPKGEQAQADFAEKWHKKKSTPEPQPSKDDLFDAADEDASEES